MSEHDKIREFLALAAAGALTRSEEDRVAAHLGSCAACSREMESLRSVTDDLRRLPTPQPSARLLQITLARAEAKLAEHDEHEWNRRVMIFVVAFAWLLTIVSWPLVRLASSGLQSLLVPQFNRAWINFAGFTALVWLAGGSAAVLLALRHRRERRMA
jgi:predicted anti-sigma-YlaC factor YlaD